MATALAQNNRKRPRVRRSSSKNAKSMRYNVPAYGTWVLSDYITAGKQPACFHCSTLARTKAHTFGTFRHPDPNSIGCLDPDARYSSDHSDSFASDWPHRSDICPSATSPIGLLGRSRSFRVAVPPFKPRPLLKHPIEGPMTDEPNQSLGCCCPPKAPHQRSRYLTCPASWSRPLSSPPPSTHCQRGKRLMRPAPKSRPLLSPSP